MYTRLNIEYSRGVPNGIIVKEMRHTWKEYYSMYQGLREGPYNCLFEVENEWICSISGYYSNGKRDREWSFYEPFVDAEERFIKTGLYHQGKKQGSWVYYDYGLNIILYGNFNGGIIYGNWKVHDLHTNRYIKSLSSEEAMDLLESQELLLDEVDDVDDTFYE